MRTKTSALTMLLLLLAPGCRHAQPPGAAPILEAVGARAPQAPDPLAPITPAVSPADRIVNRAKQEVRSGVTYDASYRAMKYPGGDVPSDRGACTDVLIRALRAAGYDLQKLIHEDARRDPARYPGLERAGGDGNIDHRRARNHLAFLQRYGRKLPAETTGAAAASWQPGDLVYWKLDNNLDHCGVLSNVRNAQGLPLVIHNIGIARQEDCLTAWRIVAHFRYPAGVSGKR